MYIVLCVVVFAYLCIGFGANLSPTIIKMQKFKVKIFDVEQNVIAADDIECGSMSEAIEKAKEMKRLNEDDGAVDFRVDRANSTRSFRQRVSMYGLQPGVRRQDKSFTFRVDNDIAELFAAVANKGRMINQLLRSVLVKPKPDLDEKPDELNDVFDKRP